MVLLEQVKEQTTVLQDKAVEKAREAGEATQAFVKDNPWKALGIAAGVGLLLGAMLKGDNEPEADSQPTPPDEPPRLNWVGFIIKNANVDSRFLCWLVVYKTVTRD